MELVAAQQARTSVKAAKRRSGTATPGGSYVPSDDERQKFQSTWILIAWVHGVNITLCLLVTTTVVFYFIHHPMIGTLSMTHAVIVWLKTYSYAFTNRDLRHSYLHPSKREEDALPPIYSQCPYPQNITLHNLAYFWWAPTLVYQPVYPRSKEIRWWFVAKRLAEVFGLSVFIWVMSAQYASPVLQNSLDKIASLDIFSILERLMKLSTISVVIWLAGFFALFQSFLNALAEVTRFGDRDFYEDWWNAPSVGVYWRTWNKPVYQFMKRHIFSPLIGRGWSSGASSIAVFVFSGVLHELMVGIPTHNVLGKKDLAECLSLAKVYRCRIHRHGYSAPFDSYHSTTREDARSQWENTGELHILGFIYTYWTALGSSPLLFRLASQIRLCQQKTRQSLNAYIFAFVN